MLWKAKKIGSQITGPTSPSTPSDSGGESPTVSSRSYGENIDVVPSRPLGAYIIPRGYRISGSLVTHRPVVIEGALQGPSLVAPSVCVGRDGYLGIPTHSVSMTIEGVVSAPIVVQGQVEVRQGGVIESSVEAGGLSMSPGAMLSGAQLAIGPLRSKSSHVLSKR